MVLRNVLSHSVHEPDIHIVHADVEVGGPVPCVWDPVGLDGAPRAVSPSGGVLKLCLEFWLSRIGVAPGIEWAGTTGID